MAGISNGPDYLRKVLPHGFESFELTCWAQIGDVDLAQYASEVLDVLGDKAIVSSLGIYGNPLQDEKTAADWAVVIRACKLFGAKVVCGFAGAVEGSPIDQNIPRFVEVFGPLAKLASDEGVKIAFENCDMGGTWERPLWNIAHCPRAWEMMFDALPGDTIGLEWEPCHQMYSLVDPIPQLRKYVGRVYHVHGKDATVCHDILRDHGTRSGLTYVYHRTPGFGDSNWSDIITILRQGNYHGSIDIEGWHDPVYRDELEMTGQVRALEYLKACRGGPYVPND